VSKAAPARASELEFRDIYDHHFDSVWHSLRRFSVAEKDLLDATQEVFLVVYKKLPEFEGRAQLGTWIFQICRRVASTYRRSAPVRREVVTDSAELSERVDELHVTADVSSLAQAVSMARAILDKLPDSQRDVFILYELEQLSGEEIAEQLCVPLGTVRSRLRLARQAFRREVALLAGDACEKKVG
jgi:RNA polymerase sigma-70 factor (ECF subfamily)